MRVPLVVLLGACQLLAGTRGFAYTMHIRLHYYNIPSSMQPHGNDGGAMNWTGLAAVSGTGQVNGDLIWGASPIGLRLYLDGSTGTAYQTVADGGTYDYTIVWGGGANQTNWVPCTTNTFTRTFAVTNDYSSGVYVQLMTGCNSSGGNYVAAQGTNTTWKYLSPGAAFSVTVSISTNSCTSNVVSGPVFCSNGGLWVVGGDVSIFADGSGSWLQGDWNAGPVGSGTYGSTPGNFNGPGSGAGGGGGGVTGGPGGGQSSTNSNPINWNNASGGGGLTEGTFQRGIAAVVSEVRAQGQTTADLLRGVQRGLSNVVSAVQSSGSATNGTSASSTNVSDAVTHSELATATNLLGQIATNTSRAQVTGATNIVLDASATNQAAAYEGGTNASASAIGSINGLESGAGSAPSYGDTNTGPQIKIEFMGAERDFSPDTIFPGALPFSKNLWTLVLLVGFSLSVGKLLFASAGVFATAETGGVPDLAILGTNALGATVAALVAVIFIGLWVAIFTWLSSQVTGYMSQLASAGGNIGTANAIAWQLLRAGFPLDLALGLVWTRIALYFGAAKVVIIAASASRFLTGK